MSSCDYDLLSSDGTIMRNDGQLNEKEYRVKGLSTNNGDRRKKPDRRQFAYTFHIPERRSGKDRRLGEDRRLIEREVVSV